MKVPFQYVWLVLALALCVPTLTGCALFGTSRPLVFQVRSSGLDVLEVYYAPAPDHPRFRTPMRMTLFGSGSVMLRRGASPRVLDGFSTRTDSPDWHDYHEHRLNASLEEMTEVFQRFVDLGLVYPIRRQPKPPAVTSFPIVRVSGKIGGHPVNRVVSEPELIGLVESILEALW